MFDNFFEKFFKISPKKSNRNRKKTNIFVSKVVQNYYIDQNLAKFSLKTPKIAYLLKKLNFSKFPASSAQEI